MKQFSLSACIMSLIVASVAGWGGGGDEAQLGDKLAMWGKINSTCSFTSCEKMI